MSATLFQLVKKYESVSIVGMCKNAGKTTALNSIVDGYEGQKKILALTSIGRDGEDVDLVTGTKKPGIYVHAGTLVATASSLLKSCDITREVLDTTGISTPMGEVVILRALSDGNVQLAGPSIVDQLVGLSGRFRQLGADRIVIDGAINRRTLSTRRLTEATVLCSGASCDREMDKVIQSTAHTCRLLMLPQLENEIERGKIEMLDPGKTALLGKEIVYLEPGTGIADGLRKHMNNKTEIVYLDGALSNGIVKPLLMSGAENKGLTFVVQDASRILLSEHNFAMMEMRGWRIRVMEDINLVAVTVNPFSAYGYHFDKDRFKKEMEKQIDVPVIDVEGDAHD